MTIRLPLSAAFLAAALILGACGGGGGDSGTGPGGLKPPLSESDDPRVARLGELLERADVLQMSSQHARSSMASADGSETIEEAFAEPVSCSGARCVAEDGTATTVQDLLDTTTDGIEFESIEVMLGARGGFDTVTASVSLEVTETLPDSELTVSSMATNYGFWGEHGYATLMLGGGPVTVEIAGTAFSGDYTTAEAYMAGDATGTNPSGTGSATWTGIAEASPTGAIERLMGTATVTIADLSQPRVGVAIDVPGHAISAPGWADMPLTNGGFDSGTAGTDYMGGNFLGRVHEEAWGVFDTTDYIGVFGTTRQP